ncbi:MAG: hypothetical protein R3D52_03390 [Xanthobacteraceae bacterium]
MPPLAETRAYCWFCLIVVVGIIALLWFFVFNRPLGNRLTRDPAQ